MQSVYEIIQRLRATSSSNAKLGILELNKDDAELQSFLRATYEPRINYYVKEVQPELMSASMMLMNQEGDFSLALINDILYTLGGRATRGNEARRWLASKYHELTPVGKELLKLMIQRDIQAGVSASTINKIWPGLITQTAYMRCSLPKAAKLETWPWADGVYSEIKADGQFANLTHRVGGAITIESRNGSPMPLDQFQDLVQEVKDLIPEGWQLHGELLMLDPQGKIMPREEGNGMFNSLLQEGELPKGYTPTYHAWDMIPEEEAVVKGKYEIPYKERFGWLIDYLEGEETKCLHLIEYKLVFSLAEAYDHCVEVMQRGLEGTVAKHPEGPWEDSDSGSKFNVKLKLEFEVDLIVRRMKAAAKKSKNAKTFGSLECESSDGELEAALTGIKDDKRAQIFRDFDLHYKDKMVITVRANALTKPKRPGEKWSLFHPRFVEDRLDKTKANSLEEIKAIQQAAIDACTIFGKK